MAVRKRIELTVG